MERSGVESTGGGRERKKEKEKARKRTRRKRKREERNQPMIGLAITHRSQNNGVFVVFDVFRHSRDHSGEDGGGAGGPDVLT